nr:uncharacterized protein CFP56_76168 [Quercus suber]
MDCIDLSYGFFLVRFFSKEDLERVIKRGPRFIGDHFLSLRPWEPFFKPSTANVSLIAVWIRLNELPIELYETEVLREIGESIGKVLRIDSHTAMEARSRYARLCIQIDIYKPLINSILIGRFEQVVTYEGIHKLCFSCGRIGHKVEACPYTIRKEKGKEPIGPTKEVQVSQTSDGVDGSFDRQNMQGVVTHNACEATDVEGYYGSAGNSAWNSTNQLSPVFTEGMSMPVGGPSSSKSVPRKFTKPKFGARVKNEVKSWATKTLGDFFLKERPTLSPSTARLLVDKFKEAVVSLIHNSSASPSTHVPITQPSLMKNEKHLAKSLASDTLHKCAAPSSVVGSDKKSNSPLLTHAPLPRPEPNQPNHIAFEFSAITNVKTGLPAESEIDRRLHVQVIRELADENMVPNEGVQLSIQSVVSKGRSLTEDQMVSDDGNHVIDHMVFDDGSHVVVHMVSDEGSGAAPFL